MTEYVYVVGEDGGPMKVGFSTNPKSRVQSLQSAYPRPFTNKILLPAADGYGRAIEMAVHRKLADHRLKGEWFAVDEYQASNAVDEVIADLELGVTLIDGDADWDWPGKEIELNTPPEPVTLNLDQDVVDAMRDEWSACERKLNSILRVMLGL